MDMQWIADLKYHTHEMQQHIQVFCEEYRIQQPQEQEYMQNLIHSADNFEAWVKALPSDANVWRWVNWPSAFYEAKSSLTGIKGYFEILLMFNEARGDSRSLSPRAQILKKQIKLILDIYSQSLTQHNNFRWSESAETERLPAYIAVYALWPFVYPWCLDYTLNIEVKTWPTVFYHPYYTPIILHQTIATFAPILRDLVVIPRKTDAAFEIRVTHPTVTMTPALWERYQTTLQHRSSLEHLRELGGSIEPLTWDEGQGQGVIVRLPWAK
jgi:hypothetical protein